LKQLSHYSEVDRIRARSGYSKRKSMIVRLLGVVLSRIGLVWGTVGSIDPELRIPIAIALGAVPGALSRFYLTRFCVQWFGTGFPYGTFIINLSGSLLMGFITTLTISRVIVSPDLRAFITVGFLGAYTTFSTYALETDTLLQSGQWGKMLFYWGGSALLGVMSLEIGSLLARRLG
jgi:fluoride exporter